VRGPVLGGWHLLIPIVALAALRGLWAPDEPRYAQIAREAWESGSLLVLHLCGELYSDKPPLVYWLAGLCGRLAGWNELALRLPSILATAGSAWIAARVARRLLGEVAARWTVPFLLGSTLVLWLGARVQLDPVLAFFVLAAVDLLWTDGGTDGERTRRAWLAGLCAGLAGLAKGPVAWLVIGCALLALRLVPSSARAPLRFRPAAWTGLFVLALLPVAGWATAAALQDERLWRPLFLGQHLGRAADADAPHSGPPWQHVWEMSAFLLPWTPLVVLGLVEAWRAWRDARRGQALERAGILRIAAWLAVVFAFFSIIPPKREVYLLPVYPAAAWLAAAAFERALGRGRLSAWVAVPAPALFLALGAGFAVAPHLAESAAPFARSALPTALALAAGGGLALRAWRRGDLARWADALALSFSVALLAAALFVVPVVDARKSARTLALEVAARPEKPASIPCVGVQPEGYRFYGRVPTVRAGPRALEAALEREGDWMLALVREREWNGLPPELRARLVVLDRGRVGSREVYVVGAAR
jgi:4-amino-4-deoxy-L-arabinose transferase-like glycosyltransferase